MDEQMILAAMQENYQRCLSYEDAGSISVTFDQVDPKTIVGSFSTVYIRPGLLKFEYSSESETDKSRVVLKSNGDSITAVFTTGDTPSDVEVFSSLKDAIHKTAGVTHGTIHKVFGLLNEIQMSRTLDTLKKLKRLSDETLDDVDCHKLSGEWDDADCDLTIWISKESYSLRRVSEKFAPTEETKKLAEQAAALIAEAEIPGFQLPPQIPMTTICNFDQVTFNNSITIDAIG